MSIAIFLVGFLLYTRILHFGIILGVFVYFARQRKIIWWFPKSKREITALLSIIVYILVVILSVSIDNKVFMGEANRMIGINVGFILLFLLILFDKFWDWLDYTIDKYIKIGLFKNFRWETPNCIIEITNKKFTNNIYCYNKLSEENSNMANICLIREIDNSVKNSYFLQLLYDNYFVISDFKYSDFIDFANRNDIFLRTFKVSKIPNNYKNHLNRLLKENGVSLIPPKKLEINSATTQEITNLPFINIIY